MEEFQGYRQDEDKEQPAPNENLIPPTSGANQDPKPPLEDNWLIPVIEKNEAGKKSNT